MGLWAITNLGIKYLMTTDTTQKTTKEVERRSKGHFYIFRVLPGPPQEMTFKRPRGTGTHGPLPPPPVSPVLSRGIPVILFLIDLF